MGFKTKLRIVALVLVMSLMKWSSYMFDAPIWDNVRFCQPLPSLHQVVAELYLELLK